MQRELLESLPKLQSLHAALKSANLADVVWMCIGGNPADYESLATKWTRQPSDLERVVALFVQNLIGRANDNVSSAVASNEQLQELYDMFRESSEVPSAILKGMKLVRSSPDKVLRPVQLRALAAAVAAGGECSFPQTQQLPWSCARESQTLLPLRNLKLWLWRKRERYCQSCKKNTGELKKQHAQYEHAQISQCRSRCLLSIM